MAHFMNAACVNLDAKGFQVDADRGSLCLSGAVIELSVVFWAFDQMAHDQTVAKINIFVGAAASGGIELPVGGVVNCIAGPGMIKPDQIFSVDIIGGAGINPLGHQGHSAGAAPRAAA